jgi:hypothetical protein
VIADRFNPGLRHFGKASNGQCLTHIKNREYY